MPTPYKALFEVGQRVRVRSREDLEEFRNTWRYHHPLSDEQLLEGGSEALVKEVMYYHGGDPIYELDRLPGIWHEDCLVLA